MHAHSKNRVYTFTGLDYWTGTLDWTTGLTYFWFLCMMYWFNGFLQANTS